MKLNPESLLHLVQAGYFSTRVPELHVTAGMELRSNGELETAVEMPDEWFCRVKIASGGARLTFGKEKGYLHLSEEGWNANRDRMREAFNPCRGTWEEFEAYVEKYQADVRERTERHRKKLLRMTRENRR